MRFPQLTPTNALLGFVGFLLVSSVLYTRESLLFCERALYTELNTLAREGTVKQAIRFTDVCPEVRERAESQLNRWLEVVLALLVQLTHPPDRG